MTTKDIIKALPMDEKLRMEILNLYPYMEKSQRFEIATTAWDTFMSIYHQLLTTNIALEIEGKAQKDVDVDYYAHAVKKTEQEIDQIMKKGLEDYDISAARIAMQRIVHEINDAKAAKAEKKLAK